MQPFNITRTDQDGVAEFHFSGSFAFANASQAWERVRELAAAPSSELRFDLGEVDAMDGGTMALLVQLKRSRTDAGVPATITRATGTVAELVKLYDLEPTESLNPVPGRLGLLAQVGSSARGMAGEAQGFLAFLGYWTRSTLAVFRAPRTIDWRSVRPIFETAGADALPIVLLINFLIGFILAFQAANQLHQFGADIFVADLVSLAVAREMGPLMTAIIICGRSGAAFAASLGTMKVSEEIDALTTLGFDPMRYLVFPRAIALCLVLPILTLIGDFVAILGGLFVGTTVLDLTTVAYISQTVSALSLWDVYSGLIKSVAFALAITFIACQQGLATSGGAEGVGRRTTSSVVAILFSLILIDCAFTVCFHVFGL